MRATRDRNELIKLVDTSKVFEMLASQHNSKDIPNLSEIASQVIELASLGNAIGEDELMKIDGLAEYFLKDGRIKRSDFGHGRSQSPTQNMKFTANIRDFELDEHDQDPSYYYIEVNGERIRKKKRLANNPIRWSHAHLLKAKSKSPMAKKSKKQK